MVYVKQERKNSILNDNFLTLSLCNNITNKYGEVTIYGNYQ